jgi:hypothetical protein
MSSTITKTQNRVLHSLLAQLEISDEKMHRVRSVTGGRTSSSTEMSFLEAKDLIMLLQFERKQALGKMWGKVITICKELGYRNAFGQEDLERIDDYIMNIGTRNPHRRRLWSLHKTELREILEQLVARHSVAHKGEHRNDK